MINHKSLILLDFRGTSTTMTVPTRFILLLFDAKTETFCYGYLSLFNDFNYNKLKNISHLVHFHLVDNRDKFVTVAYNASKTFNLEEYDHHVDNIICDNAIANEDLLCLGEINIPEVTKLAESDTSRPHYQVHYIGSRNLK